MTFDGVLKALPQLTKSQLREVATRAQFLSGTAQQQASVDGAGEAFYRLFSEQYRRHTQVEPPSLSSVRRFDPKTYHRIVAMADEVNKTLAKLFPRTSQQEHRGLVNYFLILCFNSLEERDVSPTVHNALDALLPLNELIEDQLPGYLESGILQSVVLQQIQKGDVCLAKTPSASR